MTTVPNSVLLCFGAAKNLAKYRDPYQFGAGHPYPGYIDGIKSNTKNYDCSSWVSDILRHGLLLDSSVALDTAEFLNWGEAGEGEFMTVWVINGPELQHCFLEFKILGEEQFRWSMAAHTGTICGWYKEVSTKGYSPRRRK